MKTTTKLILAAAILGTLGLGGLARSVYAKQSQSPVAIMPDPSSKTQIAQASDGDGEQPDATEAPEVKGQQQLTASKTLVAQKEASDGDREQADDAQEKQEAARLQPLAKITPQQAQQAAEDYRKGKAREVMLENDNGNLVYEVTIGQTEVAVDAGNGKVLYTEKINEEYDEATEAARPLSSIQVPKQKEDYENH